MLSVAKGSRFEGFGVWDMALNPKPVGSVHKGLPVTEKTYFSTELYIETIIRNPKKVGLFGYR